jgi:hypothetical protein
MLFALGGLGLGVEPGAALSAAETAALDALGPAVWSQAPALRLELVDEPPFDAPDCGAAAPAPADVRAHSGTLRVTHRLFRAELDPWARAGRLFRREADGTGLLITLRVALSALLPLHGGLPLHAAGVVLDGSGLVFFGPSGAGKTTLASTALARRLTVLSDEQVTLRLDPPMLRPSGFWGALDGSSRGAAPVPLAALVELGRGSTFDLAPLAPDEALRRLLGVLLVPPHPELWRAALTVVSSLTRAVPSFRLAWHPEAPPWDALRARLAPEAARV